VSAILPTLCSDTHNPPGFPDPTVVLLFTHIAPCLVAAQSGKSARGACGRANRRSVGHADPSSTHASQPTARHPPKIQVTAVLPGSLSQHGKKLLCDRVARDLRQVPGADTPRGITTLPHVACSDEHLPLGGV